MDFMAAELTRQRRMIEGPADTPDEQRKAG
jgi:hypothetical protein